MRTEGPPVSSELQLGYEDDHQNCSFDISVCGNLTEDYQAVSPKLLERRWRRYHDSRERFLIIYNTQYFMVSMGTIGSPLFGEGSWFNFQFKLKTCQFGQDN